MFRLPLLLLGEPDELNSVSEHAYPFTDDEREHGFEIEVGGPAHAFWDNITSTSPGLVDPIFKRPYLSPWQDVQSKTRSALDREVDLHAQLMAFVDRIAALDDGTLGLSVDRQSIVAAALMVAKEWDIARIVAQNYVAMLTDLRADRALRLRAAENALGGGAKRGGGWFPSAELLEAAEAEAEEVGSVFTPSTYYLLQTAACKSGRPVFSPLQLSPQLETAEDPLHRGPVAGSTLEILDRFADVMQTLAERE
jgi:hypothetical protein